MFVAFLLNKLLSYTWSRYAPIAIVGMYIISAFISIYSSKTRPIFNLKKTELLFYQIMIPLTISGVIGIICSSISGDENSTFWKNIEMWILNGDNQLLLVVVFSALVVLCYFIAFVRAENDESTEDESRLDNEIIKDNCDKSNEILKVVKDIHSILEKRSQIAYTATCIPIRYNEEHETFVFALIKNLSHEESQWMFPGSHVDVSNNQLKEDFELNEIEVIPGSIIEKKVKKEAGLLDLQFIDPYYETVGFENTINGKKQQRSYPNTCYPAKTPVFNYLFRVSKSAKCYKNQNHRCHYDFTYIGEYSKIDETQAEYEVIEIELNKNLDFKNREREDAIAQITSKLGRQINNKIKSKAGKYRKSDFRVPFDQLCLDSIPEMIYNAILFYIDYKNL